MKSIEKNIKEALFELAEEKKRRVQEGCPPEEILALYLAGTLAGPEKTRVTQHLSFCPHCLDIVALEASTAAESKADEAGITVPSRAMNRVKNLVKSSGDKTVFDVVVRLYHGTLEIIHTALRPLPPVTQPAFAALRSTEEGQAPEPVRMEKTFNGIAAEIQLEASQKGLWSIQVFLKKTGGDALPGGLRVSLKDLPLEKELQSAPVRDDVAVFQGLPAGEYELEIREFGDIIGSTSLCLT
jgi:hypothetical protein